MYFAPRLQGELTASATAAAPSAATAALESSAAATAEAGAATVTGRARAASGTKTTERATAFGRTSGLAEATIILESLIAAARGTRRGHSRLRRPALVRNLLACGAIYI